MNEQLWWYVTRSSAVIAWVLLVISVLWGILLSTRVLRMRDNPGWLLDLHRWVSGLSIVFVAFHMISLYLDKYAHFSIPNLLVPFNSTYTKVKSLGPWPVALGVLCFYVMIAIQLSSLMMKRLPRTVWKAIHYSSYALVLVVSFHAGWTGTDVRAIAYRVVALTLIAFTTVALIVRILFPKPQRVLSAQVEGRRSSKRDENPQRLVVREINDIAQGIKEFVFEHPQGQDLAEWTAGSHLVVRLGNGLSRQYSLTGDLRDHKRYAIAVLRTAQSRGGSSWLHEQVNVGDFLDVVGPHNNFELKPANHYLFIAGGIGITPIKAMIQACQQHDSWTLLYLGRSLEAMAYVHELAQQYPNKVIVHSDQQQNGRFNVSEFVAGKDAQVYVCGPEPLLAELMSHVPAENLHYERFAAVNRALDKPARAFQVQLKRSKKTLTVGAEENLLDALRSHGGQLLSSCGEGVCGTCEVRVLAGQPLHLDSVMPDSEKEKLKVMYPCVSRAQSEELVLDL